MKTQQSIEFGKEPEYFPPEIVFDQEDAKRCTPAVYFPSLLVADEQTLLADLEKAAWQVSKYKEDGEEELDTRVEEIDSNSKITYVSIKDDSGEETILKTKELKLARFGRQIVRVFGPLKIKSWEKSVTIDTSKITGETSLGSMILLKDVDLTATERLILFPNLNQKSNEIADDYEVKIKDASNYKDRDGSFAAEYNNKNKEGFFYQQRSKKDTAAAAIYQQKFKFGGTEFEREYPVPCNRGDYQKNQVDRLGRKTMTIREKLDFQKDKEKTIKYWYSTSDIRVISWSDFRNVRGHLIERRPNNYTPGKTRKLDYKTKPGATFYSEVECFGSLIVEYEVDYTEYSILYDFSEPYRYYEVIASSVEKVGYVVNDTSNNEEERDNLLKGNDIGFDKLVDDPDSEDEPPPKVAVKLIKKIRFLPFGTPKIDIMYTNGRQAAMASFTPPPPDFMDLSLAELPKIAIYEKRRRVLTPGGAEIDQIEELTMLDVMGNITSEKLEDRGEE